MKINDALSIAYTAGINGDIAKLLEISNKCQPLPSENYKVDFNLGTHFDKDRIWVVKAIRDTKNCSLREAVDIFDSKVVSLNYIGATKFFTELCDIVIRDRLITTKAY